MKYRFIQMLWTSSLAWNATSQRIASSTVPCKSPIVCQGEESTSSKKQSVVDLQKQLLMKKMQMMEMEVMELKKEKLKEDIQLLKFKNEKFISEQKLSNS